MIEYRTFTGGIFETNCYALKAPDGWILFDAPEGACDWLIREGIELRLLLQPTGTSITSRTWPRSSAALAARSAFIPRARQ